jgi:hypothetical protein
VDWPTIWDWVGKLGIGSMAGGLGGWFLQRWIGSRDKAVERGRERVQAVTPEIVPVGCVMDGNHRGNIQLRNRGRGAAREVRVTFSGSSAIARVAEIEPGPREISTRDVNFGDSAFFHQIQNVPGELKVACRDKFGNEHVVTVPVEQEPRPGGGFNMLPKWSSYQHIVPKLSKKRLREIGGW